MNTRTKGRRAALGKYGMLVAGTAILAFGLYNIHRQSNITEGGVLGLVLFFDHWLGITPALISPDRGLHGLRTVAPAGITTNRLDAAFPGRHGKNGEDGTIQGLFELAGIPYVGCGTVASANCMDKEVTHTILEAAGITMAKWRCLRAKDMENFEVTAAALESALGYPMFVKPANAGSSVGVSKAKDLAGLKTACQVAFREDSKIIVEEFIQGREVENAVLGNENPKASPVCGEIAPLVEFYTYDAKYNDETTALYVPARITPQVGEKIQIGRASCRERV